MTKRPNDGRTLPVQSEAIPLDKSSLSYSSRIDSLASGAFNSLCLFGPARLVDWELRLQCGHLLSHSLFLGGVADGGEDVGDPVADLRHFGFAHAAGGYRRGAQADAAAFHVGQGIEGDGIFVYGDARAVQGF